MPKVLLIEDEPAIAENVTYALETEAFSVAWCETGQKGLSLIAEADDIDLVVLDIGLPDQNGFDLCRTIRQSSTVPIIFLTARGEEVDRVVGLELGGDDYVVKPFSPRELVARIRAVLRRSGAESTAVPGCGPFVVDEPRKRILYRGELLPLSRYEFRILKLLLARPGWVFSRQQLMDQAWEEPEASYDRTVDTHMKTLRAKLRGVDPDHDPIRTHRGQGYSLRDPP